MYHVQATNPVMTTLQHIQSIVRGEVWTDAQHLEAYSLDGSIFTQTPRMVVAPKDAGDIQAILHLLWTYAKAGKEIVPVAVRGSGTDQAGGPLTDGIVLDVRRHMNQILEFGEDFVRVEPGVRYGELQAELKKRGRFLPPYPASLELCTIGGAVANNSSGEKTVKYGDTRDYVTHLKVVLANGDEVELRGLDTLETEGMVHHRTFEGQLYRKLHQLLARHPRERELPKFHVTKNSTGYAVWEIAKRGNFDLTKLFVGSQGTLGVITEITLRTEPLPPATELIAVYLSDLEKMAEAVEQLLPLGPSALEIVDHNLLRQVDTVQPGHLDGLVPTPHPAVVLLVEFDDHDDRARTGKRKAAESIVKHYADSYRIAKDETEQENLWKLRRSAAAVIWGIPGDAKPLPIVEDGIVPVALLPNFLRQAYALFAEFEVDFAVWGHAGDANLHIQPIMNLGSKEDREKLFPLVDRFHAMVMELGGCISAEHNDGLLRSPYLRAQYGEELYGIFEEVKHLFDPYAYLNPRKKVDFRPVSELPELLRDSYSLGHLVQDKEHVNR